MTDADRSNDAESAASPAAAAPELPLIGDAAGRIRAVTRVDIHSDRYFDVALLLDGEQAPIAVRLPAHACPRPPREGDRVSIQLLMGQPQAVTFADDSG